MTAFSVPLANSGVNLISVQAKVAASVSVNGQKDGTISGAASTPVLQPVGIKPFRMAKNPSTGSQKRVSSMSYWLVSMWPVKG